MQLFKAFMKSLWVHRLTMFLYLGIFLLITLLLGVNRSASDERMFASENLKVVVIDQDQSTVSRALAAWIRKTEDCVDLHTTDLTKIKDSAAFGVIDYCLIIPKGAGEKLLSGKCADGSCTDLLECISYPRSAGGYLMTRKINTFLQKIVIWTAAGNSAEDAVRMASDETAGTAQVTMLAGTAARGRNSLYNIYLYTAYSLLLMLIIGISKVMIEFSAPELRRRLACAAVPKGRRNLELLLAYIATGTAAWAVFVLLSLVMHHSAQDLGQLDYYAVNAYVIMLFGLAAAFFLNSVTKSDNVIEMTANAGIVSMSFLSGIFVDQQYMQANVLSFARFLPTYWYVKADILFRDSAGMTGAVMKTYLGYLGMELLFAVAFIAAGSVICSKKQAE